MIAKVIINNGVIAAFKPRVAAISAIFAPTTVFSVNAVAKFIIDSLFFNVFVNWATALYAIIILIKALTPAPTTSNAEAFPSKTSLKVENVFLIELIAVYVAIAAPANCVHAVDA